MDTTRASPSGKASAFQADIRRFESGRPLQRARSSVAERTAHNRLVVGSIPTGPTFTLLDVTFPVQPPECKMPAILLTGERHLKTGNQQVSTLDA